MALLGDIKCIPDAEAANAERDYHRCFLAVDNHYMVLGGQDTELFRKEVESYRIQPGQDLNSIWGSSSARHREVDEYRAHGEQTP